MSDYVVNVPEIHYERRLVRGAEDPQDAVKKATSGDYRSEGSSYYKAAAMSPETPVSVFDAKNGALAACLIGTNESDTRNSPMAKTAPVAAAAAVVVEDTEPKPSVFKAAANVLLTDAKSAAYRTAAEEVVTTVKAPLCAALMKQVGVESDSFIGKGVGKFFETRMGDGVLSLGLSVIFPMVQNSLPASMRNHSERMGTELRVRGLHNIAAPLVQAVTGPLRTIMVMQIEQFNETPVTAELPATAQETVTETVPAVAKTA